MSASLIVGFLVTFSQYCLLRFFLRKEKELVITPRKLRDVPKVFACIFLATLVLFSLEFLWFPLEKPSDSVLVRVVISLILAPIFEELVHRKILFSALINSVQLTLKKQFMIFSLISLSFFLPVSFIWLFRGFVYERYFIVFPLLLGTPILNSLYQKNPSKKILSFGLLLLWALISQSLVFTVNHDFEASYTVFLNGIFFALVYYLSRNISCSVFAHFCLNLFYLFCAYNL
ncbi:hypothetical protein DRN62_04025 [Nanoarchaeota archaeon]|nr:MAG: hypothetical protein DRN62_04025 [Nanoarchaeota archaeon]